MKDEDVDIFRRSMKSAGSADSVDMGRLIAVILKKNLKFVSFVDEASEKFSDIHRAHKLFELCVRLSGRDQFGGLFGAKFIFGVSAF